MAPAVIPLITKRCRNAKATMTGIIVMIMPAATPGSLEVKKPSNKLIPTGSVLELVVPVNTSARMNSLYEKRKWKVAIVARAG